MNRSQAENRKINSRYKRAAERLWENSSLRDDLNDDQAKRLLNWGSDYLKRVANKTAELPDDEAGNLLEVQTDRVGGVLRQVNRLAEAVRSEDDQQVTEQIKVLRENLEDLSGVAADFSTNVEEWAASPEKETDRVLEHLMNLLKGEKE